MDLQELHSQGTALLSETEMCLGTFMKMIIKEAPESGHTEEQLIKAFASQYPSLVNLMEKIVITSK